MFAQILKASMKTKKIIILSFILINSIVFSQNQLLKLDYQTLKKEFFNSPTNKKKQNVYAKAFLEKAKKENNKHETIRGYYYHSLLYKETQKSLAIEYLDTVIQLSINTNDDAFPNSAYCEKAAILETQFKYKEALENYLIAEKYALANNRMEDYYNVRYFIGLSKSENLGEVQEAQKIFKEVFNYFKKHNPQSYIYEQVAFAMADSYKALKVSDSATYYNKLGYKLSQKSMNLPMLYMFTLNEGANLVIKKKYSIALDSVTKAIPQIKKYQDTPNLMASYFYLGKIYEGLGNKTKAVENFIKVDSIHTTDKIMYPELIEGYHYLITHYKKNGNKEKQLEFLNKYISIDSVFQKNHNNMYKLLVKEYDIPTLVREKENLIQSLQSYNSVYLIILGIFLLGISGLIYNHYKTKEKYKARFKEIIEEHQKRLKTNILENVNQEQTIEKTDEQVTNLTKATNSPNEVEKRILQNLIIFESEKRFLKKGITLQSLSKELETNTVYLSKTINTYKEKKFSDYINDLRIDECVNQLQENSNFFKYTIEAIAQEFGFNNEDTFSNAFQKRVKLKPSYFINELKNTIDNHCINKN